MKEIKAIIRLHKLSDVVDALHAVKGVPGLTVSEVKGFGRSPETSLTEKRAEVFPDYAKRAKLEIVIPDAMLDEIVRIITTTACTGREGDGMIFVSSVEDAIRIRTALPIT